MGTRRLPLVAQTTQTARVQIVTEGALSSLRSNAWDLLPQVSLSNDLCTDFRQPCIFRISVCLGMNQAGVREHRGEPRVMRTRGKADREIFNFGVYGRRPGQPLGDLRIDGRGITGSAPWKFLRDPYWKEPTWSLEDLAKMRAIFKKFKRAIVE